jgi:hypothetical protein
VVARFVRFRLEAATAAYPWMVTDVVVQQE